MSLERCSGIPQFTRTFENGHAVDTYLAVMSTLRSTYDWILVILVAMYSQGYENVL